MTDPSGPNRTSLRERLEQLAQRARLVLAWERVWPAIVPILTILATFVAVSWLGLWLDVPRWGRVLGIGLFGLALLYALFRLVRVGIPSRADALSRLDRDSGLPHRPASTIDDTLANASGDATTSALWELHRKRAEQAASKLRLALPSPRVVERDRYALRALAFVAMIAAGFVAGPEKYARLLAGFDWQTEGALAQSYRLDAWIDPPAYTGKPPIILSSAGAAVPGQAPATSTDSARKIQAPAGSMVVVRTSDGSNVTAEVEGGLDLPKAPATAAATDGKGQTATAVPAPQPQPVAVPAQVAAAPATANAETQNQWVLHGDGRLILKRFGSVVAAFDITSLADKPPSIALTGDPTPNARGSLTLAYKIDDDYGVIGAEANFSKPIVRGKPFSGRALVDPPKVPLSLPAGPGGLGKATTTADVSSSPWAGAGVTMVLSARDEGGNTGYSDPVAVTLPQRVFTKPLARALVEQRRDLVFAPDDRSRVGVAIDALMIAPDTFKTSPSIYLGLETIGLRLSRASSDADLLDVADFMWQMALRIEDGGLSDAERDLRAAQQALRDALQRGASPEEVQKLTQDLRAALDKFLSQLAQQSQQNQNGQQQAQNQNQRTITSQDLQSMLNRLQDMAKNGDMADAQQMLDQLQNLLENLQSAQQSSPMDQAQQQMNRALSDLDKLTRQQQALRDKTYQQGKRQQQQAQRRRNGQQQQGQQQQGQQQQGQQQGQQGQQGDQDQAQDQDGQDQGDQDADNQDGQQQGGQNGQSLAQQQQQLRQQLQQLEQTMKQLGMSNSQGLSDAEQAMNEAQQDLQQGQGGQGDAVGAQGRALDALRRGAQSMAQQMQQMQQGNGNGNGQPNFGNAEGNPNGQMREGNNDGNADPLGRESHQRVDNSRSVYDPLGVPAAQRAQQVLEELRRRLSDPSRPREELDYLGRLMQRY